MHKQVGPPVEKGITSLTTQCLNIHPHLTIISKHYNHIHTVQEDTVPLQARDLELYTTNLTS